MLFMIIYAIMILFVLIGVIATVYYAMVHIVGGKSEGYYTVIIPADAESEDIAAKVCAAHMRYSLIGKGARGRVIAIDLGMNDRDRQACDALCRDLKGVFVCTPETFLELIKKED